MTVNHRSRPVGLVYLSLVAALLATVAGCAQQRPVATTTASMAINEPPLLRASAQPVALRSGHPQRYVVQPGDTLWDIAARFLNSPWRWSEIWQLNPEINNPHLIYPGDVIELFYEGDQPRLRLATFNPDVAGRDTGGGDTTSGGRPIIRLSPKVRVESITQPIPTIPRDVVAPFLESSRILSDTEWELMPYVVGSSDQRISYATGDRIYVRGDYFDRSLYSIFRPGEVYEDPETAELLGYESIFLGEAQLISDGDPATLLITSSQRGIKPGDRLFPEQDEDVIFQFTPRSAPDDAEGRIIDAPRDNVLLGRYTTVVLNLGEFDGMEPGHVLAVYDDGDTVKDPITGESIELPSERSGLIMVYKVFDRLSYGLIMEATRTIRVQDSVGNPS